MLQRWPLLITLLASIASSAPASSTKSGGSTLLAFFTGLQSSQLTTKNAKTILAPIVVLHALEHLVCGNTNFGRKLTGTETVEGTNNPRRLTSVFFLLAVKTLYHVIPTLLQGKSLVTGIKRFITSGHLAHMLLVPPFPVYSKNVSGFLWTSIALLIAHQAREVYTIHKAVADECKKLKISNPFERSFEEPSQTHIKLPRYLTQDLCGRNFQSALLLFFRKLSNAKHFNYEFEAAPAEYHPFRHLNEPLLPSALPRLQESSRNFRFGIPHYLLAYFFAFLAFPSFSGLARALVPLTWLNSQNLFLSKATFQKLSPGLQNKIRAFNEQELIFAFYNLANPMTERAFSLAQYAFATERSRYEIDELPHEALDYTGHHLPIIRTWNTTGAFTTNYVNIPNCPNPLNYKEESLRFFSSTAPLTAEDRDQARQIAREVLGIKPTSRLAENVIKLTTNPA